MSDLVIRTPSSELRRNVNAARKSVRLGNTEEPLPSPPTPQARPALDEPEGRPAPRRPTRRPADGDPRHHRSEHRAAEPRHGARPDRLQHQLDDHELLADLRQPAALRRPRRRSARAAPDVPDRPRYLHRLLVRLRDRRHGGCSVRGPGGPGPRRALLSPAALAIIMSTFQGGRRAKALAAWGAVGGAGAAIGVLVGGILTELTDWRMIFYVNLPVAAALAIAARTIIPADTEKPHWKGLDLRGAVLATASLGATVFAITQAEGAGWTSVQTHLFGIGGLTGLVAFALLERRARTPLLRVERLADRAVGGGLVLMLAAAGSIFGLFLLSSLYLQNVLGWGPLSTGLAFIPLALAAGAGAHVSGHIVGKHGVRGPLAGAFLVAAAGMTLLAHVGENDTYVRDVLPGMLIAGLGLGVAVVAVAIAVLAGARDEESGMIS